MLSPLDLPSVEGEAELNPKGAGVNCLCWLIPRFLEGKQDCGKENLLLFTFTLSPGSSFVRGRGMEMTFAFISETFPMDGVAGTEFLGDFDDLSSGGVPSERRGDP